jgi:hypothetical protein
MRQGHLSRDGVVANIAQMQRQGGIHGLRVHGKPGPQFIGHLTDHGQLACAAALDTFTHHLQHHLVLGGVAVAAGETRGLHPAVFARKVLVGVCHQFAPKRQQGFIRGADHAGQQI